MTTFLVRRLGFLVFVVFGVSVLTFAISHLVPADPVALVAGKETSPEKLAQIRHIYGLDKPLPLQYVTYMERLLQGDLGLSSYSRRPVLDDFRDYFPATVELTLYALLLCVLMGLPLGVYSGLYPSSWLDHLTRIISVAGTAVPIFWLGLLLQWFFYGHLGWLVLAAGGAHLAPYGPQALDLTKQNSPPTRLHLFGTDDLGRDLFSQVIAGARYSLTAVVVVLSLALLIGLGLGAAAGYVGGLVDEILMRVTDIFFAFPTIILAMAIAASLGTGLTSCMAAITAVWWPSYARLVRGQVLVIKNYAYVDAARSLGASHARIIAAHILRNGMAPVLVQLTLDMGGVLVTFAGLSFLGLGAPIGSPEWGALTSAGQGYLLDYWWLAIFPGTAIFITALLLNLLGDTFQELLDPGAAARL